MSYDAKYIRFIVLFNEDEDYFECHEVMEALWLEEGRSLYYQGLLQTAVGLYHWRNDNITGAVKLFEAALNKLKRFGGVEQGLDLEQLRADTQRSHELLASWLEANGSADRQALSFGSPPPFQSFRIVVTEPELAALANKLAELPPEERLHKEEDE